MKKTLIVLGIVTLVGSSTLISACSSKQTKTETSASEPTTVPQQQQQLANDANLGASSTGRGR